MTVINPFKALRPADALVDKIAALPYDVYNRKEAKEIVAANPHSFLQIDRGETLLDDTVSTYDDIVYETAASRLDEMTAAGEFVEGDKEAFYLYELEWKGRIQRGVVGCVLALEYEKGIIKKHENTREVKELDRIRHIDALNAHTGPIFLTYKNNAAMIDALDSAAKSSKVIFEFTGDDEVRHKGYLVDDDAAIKGIRSAAESLDSLYIADGHHRAASAAKVAGMRNYEGESAQFLAVAFPNDELKILDYNRVVKDLNGLAKETFLSAVEDAFKVEAVGDEPFVPKEKATFGMYLDNVWYKLSFRKLDEVKDDPVDSLDVAILQDYLLKPILGIEDPRTSERIDFVGGIRGLGELEKRVSEDMEIAFSMKPTSIDELIDVSDAGLLMPPKSTWFEPKLRSGLFIHKI